MIGRPRLDGDPGLGAACTREIAGGLYGLLVGDALGVPYEFHDSKNLPPAAQIEISPPDGFRRSHHEQLPGTSSDDGAHALCLLDSLLTRDRLDLDDLGSRLVRWWNEGLWCVDDEWFDIGNQTTEALLALEGGAALRTGGRRPRPIRRRGAAGDRVRPRHRHHRVSRGRDRRIRDGVGAIPTRWRDALRGRDRVEPLLAALLRR